MAAYAVFEPPMRGRSAAEHADRFVFMREGFSFWAFLFGVLWIIWRRLWLVLIIYVALVGLLQYGLMLLGISPSARTAVTVLIHLLLGMEAATLRRWTMVRRGWRDWGVVIADDVETAERNGASSMQDRPAARLSIRQCGPRPRRRLRPHPPGRA
jgi:hypothetical protein